MTFSNKKASFFSLIPHALTSGNLCCGLISIVATSNSEFFVAAAFLAISMIFDFLDGRAARRLSVPSSFGKEYDSLSDQISFGVAPAFMYYKWVLVNLHPVLSIGVFLMYVLAVSIRLARFNTGASKEKTSSNYFEGLSSPIAAAVLAGVVGTYSAYFIFPPSTAFVWIPIPIILSLLMMSKIPFYSFKSIAKKQRNFFFIIGAFITPFWFWKPLDTLLVLAFSYILLSLGKSALSFTFITKRRNRTF